MVDRFANVLFWLLAVSGLSSSVFLAVALVANDFPMEMFLFCAPLIVFSLALLPAGWIARYILTGKKSPLPWR